eukprot:CAMPEP_0178843838 /NCGR_PEP_ID=MMETSP0746-20121128/16414_1 /TAXON_ID=913974 /ORGANISM="Nitzschia punctata, Strain CCMP561" /LENGTH=231 /DNA_ID=CAMNT_0020507587 /DNA_START=45 /DNA_END=739 /DNA_ORIENTATION=-
MNNLGSDMRQRIAIQYYNEAGTKETGIDAGGLFKEFWTDLSAIAFDLNFALFCINDNNCMYPNPSSGAAHGSDHIVLFEFLGRILGKSLYENITIQPPVFLSFLRGNYNYLHMFSDLSTMDSQLYNNLMFLKTYDGDAEDLCLSFTVTVDDFGGTREIPLLPNGANIEVSNFLKIFHGYLIFSVDDFGGTREIPLLPNGANIEVSNLNKHRYIGECTHPVENAFGIFSLIY